MLRSRAQPGQVSTFLRGTPHLSGVRTKIWGEVAKFRRLVFSTFLDVEADASSRRLLPRLLHKPDPPANRYASEVPRCLSVRPKDSPDARQLPTL